MPCHHSLEDYLDAYLDGCGLRSDPKGALFRTIERGRGSAEQHAATAGQRLRHDRPPRRGRRDCNQVSNHTFRATGIAAYLKNGGTLENAAAMANHASTRTTQL